QPATTSPSAVVAISAAMRRFTGHGLVGFTACSFRRDAGRGRPEHVLNDQCSGRCPHPLVGSAPAGAPLPPLTVRFERMDHTAIHGMPGLCEDNQAWCWVRFRGRPAQCAPPDCRRGWTMGVRWRSCSNLLFRYLIRLGLLGNDRRWCRWMPVEVSFQYRVPTVRLEVWLKKRLAEAVLADRLRAQVVTPQPSVDRARATLGLGLY